MEQPMQVVVVGAGAAGSAAASALRESVQAIGRSDLKVTVVGAEDRLPYNRTTVNKGLLSGAVNDTGNSLPGMADLGVDWRTGSVADALDAATLVVTLRDGARVQGDAVVLATGAAPRPLPAPVEDAARHRVLQLRTAADTHRLRALLAGADTASNGSRRVVVAGAGLIGTEAAAVLQGLGCEVSLVDPSPLPMARHVGRQVAAWMVTAHRAAGVDLRLETRIVHIRADEANVLVDLSDGQSLKAAAVVACLGVEPATAWLTGSDLPTPPDGAPSGGGIIVDAGQRVTSFPGVYAAGDLALVPGPDGNPTRVEHWGVALEQGRIAAASVLSDLGITAPGDAGPPARGNAELQHLRPRHESDHAGLANACRHRTSGAGRPSRPPLRPRAAGQRRPSRRRGRGRWGPGGQRAATAHPAPRPRQRAGPIPFDQPGTARTRTPGRSHPHQIGTAMEQADTHLEAVLRRPIGAWTLVLTLAAEVARTCWAACEKGEHSC